MNLYATPLLFLTLAQPIAVYPEPEFPGDYWVSVLCLPTITGDQVAEELKAKKNAKCVVIHARTSRKDCERLIALAEQKGMRAHGGCRGP
jgi:hypothetical protein